MLPEIWGKPAWDFIHLVTLDYPEHPTEKDKQNYYDFFHNLQYVLPCAKCRNNLANHLEKYPLTNQVLANRSNLVKWAIDLHNIVNYNTSKPMLTYTEALNEINKLTQQRKSSFGNKLYYLIIIVILVILCYLIYRCISKKKLKK